MKNKWFQIVTLFVLFTLIFNACEDKVEKDTTSPTVKFVNPTLGSILSGTVNIEFEIKDDKELKSLSITIDNESFVTDSTFMGRDTLKVSYELKTKSLTNSDHVMKVSITDMSDNIHTESVSFQVDNQSKWITRLPEDYLCVFIMEKSDGYIILVEHKQNDYDSKYKTFLLNQNGELGSLIDTYPDLIPYDDNNSVLVHRQTKDGLYFIRKNKIIKINNDGFFDLSYSINIDFENFVRYSEGSQGENLIASNNGWIGLKKETYPGFIEFHFYNLDDSDVEIKRIKVPEKMNIWNYKLQLIGSISDSTFILTDMEFIRSVDFRFIYIDLINPEKSFVDSVSELSPSENYNPFVRISKPPNRIQLSDDGYFILFDHNRGLLLRYENESFTHEATLETDNRFEHQYFIRENDIIMFGGDADKIFNYSKSGSILVTKNIRDAFGYYNTIQGVRTNIMKTNDGGLVFSNIGDRSASFTILKIDSKLNLPKE